MSCEFCEMGKTLVIGNYILYIQPNGILRMAEPKNGYLKNLCAKPIRYCFNCGRPLQEQEPLTMEKLERMVRQPVWFKTRFNIFCGILGIKKISEDKYRMVVGFAYGWEWLDDVLKTATPYRHKPEEKDYTKCFPFSNAPDEVKQQVGKVLDETIETFLSALHDEEE